MHDEITEFKRSCSDLLVIIALDLILIVLDPEQSLVPSFFDLVEGVEQHIVVELNVLRHLRPSEACDIDFCGSHGFDTVCKGERC